MKRCSFIEQEQQALLAVTSTYVVGYSTFFIFVSFFAILTTMCGIHLVYIHTAASNGYIHYFVGADV